MILCAYCVLPMPDRGRPYCSSATCEAAHRTATIPRCIRCAGPLPVQPFASGGRIKYRPGRPPKYCSDKCRREQELERARARRPIPPARPCAHCGQEFRGHRGRKYCSPACKSSAQHLQTRVDGRYEKRKALSVQQRAESKAPCSHCHRTLPVGRTAHCGAPECRKAFNRDRMRKFHRIKSDEARGRGESYTMRWVTPERKAARLASLAEWRATPEGRERGRELRDACAARRRAKKLGSVAEVFIHREIFERDGWICGLCGQSVDRDRKYPDPASPSLDHIIPLSFDDGHHTRENVQLAHLRCNLAKGARVA